MTKPKEKKRCPYCGGYQYVKGHRTRECKRFIRELVNVVLQDLIIDMRVCKTHRLDEDALEVSRKMFRDIWKTRHKPVIDRYGWPVTQRE